MIVAGIRLLVVFVGLLIGVKKGVFSKSDEELLAKVVKKRRPLVTRIMLFFTALGKGPGTMGILVLLALEPTLREKVTLPAGISLLVTWGIARQIKKSVKRLRPADHRLVEEVDHSFPSYHAAISGALYGNVALGASLCFPQWAGWFYLFAAMMITFIASSRVYLGIHYPSDVLGGATLGLGIAFLVEGFLTIG